MSSAARAPDRIRVAHFLPDLAIGGGQEVFLRIARARDRELLDLDVLSFGDDATLADELRAAGVTVDVVTGRTRRAQTAAAAGRCAERGVDLLHTHGTAVDRFYGQRVAARLGLPLVTTLHGMRPDLGPWSLRPRYVLRRVGRWLARASAERRDRRLLAASIAVSRAVHEDWRATLTACGLDPARQYTIPSGLILDDGSPPAESERPAARAAVGIEPDDLTLVCVSRLVTSKNVPLLVPMLEVVLQREPHARLLVVGAGPELEPMRADAARRGLTDRITWLGARRDVHRILPLADLLVFPSTREGFGLVVLEALAAGVPVVSSALPSLDLLVAQGAEIRFASAPTAAAFGDAIVDLLADSAARTRMSRIGREVVATHWNASDTARAYLEVYREVLHLASGSTSTAPNST